MTQKISFLINKETSLTGLKKRNNKFCNIFNRHYSRVKVQSSLTSRDLRVRNEGY